MEFSQGFAVLGGMGWWDNENQGFDQKSVAG